MITKKFSTKQEIKEFKTKYENGDIETEVISNLLQPYHADKFPEIKNYCDFWWPEDKELYGLTGVLQIIIIGSCSEALADSFGKPDFKFSGNREYQNYILDFDGLTIIGSTKREIVLPLSKGVRTKLVHFENAFAQFVLDYINKNTEKLSASTKEYLFKIKEAGLIDSNNQIDFQYFNKTKTNQAKIK